MVQSSSGSLPQGTARPIVELPPGSGHGRFWRRLPESTAYWDVANVLALSMLDRVQLKLRGTDEDVESAMKDLLATLWKIKSTSSEEVWESVISQCISHPVRELIHEDPFASRCFQKPRGYAGDAVLIDYLYTRRCDGIGFHPVSNLGKRIFGFTRDIPAGHAVRKRRDLMAGIIDEVCSQNPAPHILSVACGHLREASLSKAVTSYAVETFIALDQDQLSLSVVDQELSRFGVRTVNNSIKAVFRGPVADQKYDLIYSTGLYDYLDDRIAAKLTHRMFSMLNPGGRLVIANFVSNLLCSAYMEALLDWKLIYRDLTQVDALASGIAESEVATRKSYIEENGNIAFLDMTRS